MILREPFLLFPPSLVIVWRMRADLTRPHGPVRALSLRSRDIVLHEGRDAVITPSPYP